MNNRLEELDWLLMWAWTVLCGNALLALSPAMPLFWRAAILTLTCAGAGSLWAIMACLACRRRR